ncbi:uncharacterized protein LOC131682856 isoform X2 [Topomyia yanbarensis]|uniref:uncharacterized protein LOC131682856 isoform X2 n=1 Tax=Topomyia yanbarensis TaxID=2498891 RepID=UPI00273AC29E|nr:uncharacterized protein LOC131682856 isoform X2 [Topomyia yanbarensis]
MKIDESSSFICFRCYNKLYEPNDPETEEAVAGPSRIAVPETFETLTAIAGPSGFVSFSYQESLEAPSSESIVTTYNAPLSDDNEILTQLKEKYKEIIDSNERYRIFTTPLKGWTTYRIMQEFNVSQYMANEAKALQQEQEIMVVPEKSLSSAAIGREMITCVTNFYNSDCVNRVCAGKRDYLISNNEEGKIHVQRRLVLCNLQEA